MYTVYVVVLNQNTPMVGKTLFWGAGWRGGGDDKFSVLFKGGAEKELRGNRCFVNICFQFQEPPGGNKWHFSKYQ